MKVCYAGETSFMELTNGKVYDVLSIEKGWYRIVVDEPISDDYLYPPELFDVTDSAGRERLMAEDAVRFPRKQTVAV
jgi:hypothetical protein